MGGQWELDRRYKKMGITQGLIIITKSVLGPSDPVRSQSVKSLPPLNGPGGLGLPEECVFANSNADSSPMPLTIVPVVTNYWGLLPR